MSRQSRGLQKEHELAKEVYEITGGSVMPMRCGYSGNQALPSPDLLVPLNGSLRAVELKTSSQKRMVVSNSDCDDIAEWATEMTELPTFPYLSVKFPYYEMQTFRIDIPWDLTESFERICQRTTMDTNVTKSGNISFGNPTEYDCDVQGSTASPGDAAALLRDLESDKRANLYSDRDELVSVYEVLEQRDG